MFDSENVVRLLSGNDLIKNIYYFDTLVSTNTAAMGDRFDVGDLIVAGYQTNGRGRSGRFWENCQNENLYFSIVMPEIPTYKILPLNIAAGYALCDALRSYCNVYMKWPNDIVFNKKKLCGMLIDAKTSSNSINKYVLGVGINVNAEIMPESIRSIASSLYIETGIKYKLEIVLAEYINELKRYFDLLVSDALDIISLWKDYSANYGRDISMHTDGKLFTFKEKGININGCLIVEKESGEEIEIISGDIGYDFCC